MTAAMTTTHDVLIIGGGPAGLSAALALGRARKDVVLCDAGPRRNAAASAMHNFVTRDGTPPQAFRELAREQLAAYPNVSLREASVQAISGGRGDFTVTLKEGTLKVRRVVLCTGMLDEPLALEGAREAWGHSIIQCPYCHGWELKDRPWGYLARPGVEGHLVPFVLQLRGWTREVTVFTNDTVELGPDVRRALESAAVRVVTAPIARLRQRDGQLEQVELRDGATVPCAALFAHPPQRQVEVVALAGVALDDDGFVRVDPMTRETSVPGIYAAGDLTTRMQGAVLAAAAGMHAAAMLNVELTLEHVARGAL